MKKANSYRESFGLDLPPAGTYVQVKFMAGVNYYINWVLCPDLEPILYGWTTKDKAHNIVKQHNWNLV